MTPDLSDSPLRVLVVDDHELVRQGVCNILNREQDIEVAGEADCGRDALARAEQLRPDVVLMDVSMSNMDGLTATLALKKSFPDVHVVALSMFTEPAVAEQMAKAGAEAYLYKGCGVDDLVGAVRRCRGSAPDPPH